MSICVYAAGQVLACLAASAFSLQWTHSVEKTRWIEHWQVQDNRMLQTRAFVKGSGAGMEPGDHAVLRNGWYEWTPHPPLSVTQLELANSGATLANWMICALPENTVATCINTAVFDGQGIEVFLLKPGLQNQGTPF